ncbi:hypothetical protein Tco_0199981 [Tanacetum coccineum]
MSFVAFHDIIKHLVHAPVASLYYCKVGTLLRVCITSPKKDADIDDFVYLGYQNKWVVDLYVEHNGYDVLDIRDQAKILVHDEGNKSGDAYCSSDDEDLGFVNFHTKIDDNVVIKTLTTSDPFLNKLCSNNGHFRGFIDEPVNANVERVVEDTECIDPEFNVKQGMTYLRHDPTQDWNKIESILGMRFEHPKQLILCLANYEVTNRCAGYNTKKRKATKQLFSTEYDDKEPKDGTSKSPQTTTKSPNTTTKSPQTTGKSGEGCSQSPKWTKSRVASDRGKLWVVSTLVIDIDFYVKIDFDDDDVLGVLSLDSSIVDMSLMICVHEKDMISLVVRLARYSFDKAYGLTAWKFDALDGVSDWLPNAEHRKCTRHAFANFKKKLSGVELQRLF